MDGVHGKDHKDPRALAATALNLMLQAAVEPTPDNFALWYTYSSGSVPALNREIDQLRHAATIDADSCRRLHTMFLEAENDASALEEAARHIEHSIANALSVITQAGEDSAGFARSITRLSQNIPAKPDASTLQRVTTELLNETRSMIQKARVLLDRLNGSKQEIVSLRSELDVVRREAETDALTGIGNRKMLDRALAHEIEQSTTHGGPLSLLMIDIDHFKKFNDSYGHLMGDEVLKLFARVLRSRVKSTDVVTRYGGEEFAIVLPRTGLDGALAAAERVHGELAARSLRSLDKNVDYGSITVSIGAAQYNTGETADRLIDRADKALYKAKVGGRNQVLGMRADETCARAPG